MRYNQSENGLWNIRKSTQLENALNYKLKHYKLKSKEWTVTAHLSVCYNRVLSNTDQQLTQNFVKSNLIITASGLVLWCNFRTKFIDLIELDSKLDLLSRVSINCKETTRKTGNAQLWKTN